MYRIKYLIPLVSLAIMLMTTACSYVSDAIEAAITNRASFGVEVDYNSTTDEVTLTWDKDESGEGAFAGFEIYVTEQPNDEYAGYTIRASRYKVYDVDGATTDYEDPDLSNGSSITYIDDVSDIVSDPDTGTGIYYFRVGVVYWDEEKVKDRTGDNGYTIDPTDGWDTEDNYNKNTDIETVSGYAQVVLE